MLSCKQITELATEHADGALDAATRARLEAHLGGCPACRAWVGQLRLTAAALGSLPPPELPPALAAELERRFEGWRERLEATRGSGPVVAGRPGLGALPAVIGALAALVGLARNPSRAPRDWLLGLSLAAVAVGLAALVRRLTARFAVAALSAALVAALVAGGEGPLGATDGLDCLATLVAMAAGATGVAWLLARRKHASPERSALAAWAVAGALAGDAGLQISCGHHASLPHLLVFHAAGVLAVVAAAWWLARPSSRTA